MSQIEEPRKRRITQPSNTTPYRYTAVEWALANPQTIPANNNRQVCTVQLYIPGGGTITIATGGQVASATNGIIFDATNGPTIRQIENINTISIFAHNGTEVVNVEDESVTDGTLE